MSLFIDHPIAGLFIGIAILLAIVLLGAIYAVGLGVRTADDEDREDSPKPREPSPNPRERATAHLPPDYLAGLRNETVEERARREAWLRGQWAIERNLRDSTRMWAGINTPHRWLTPTGCLAADILGKPTPPDLMARFKPLRCRHCSTGPCQAIALPNDRPPPPNDGPETDPARS